MKYKPDPIDTSRTVIPEVVREQIEKLSENIHDIWGKQRIEDGWTYGDHRDDITLKHPSLVPYNELPESEKVYDRNTVTETIKCLIEMGFTLSKSHYLGGATGENNQ